MTQNNSKERLFISWLQGLLEAHKLTGSNLGEKEIDIILEKVDVVLDDKTDSNNKRLLNDSK